MLGHVVHLDYLFFENDRKPIECEPTSDNKGVIIYCTFCLAYLKGIMIPIQCCIVLHGNDN